MAQEKKSKVSILTNGIIKENPVLRLVLGTCSTLAVTTAVSSALGMGAAFTFVLVCANIMISLLRKVIPGKVHLPCYIVIIASFVTIVQMFMQAYMESLYNALGVFLPLIVVNCIILGRAEMFACKNSIVDSALDGVGMGVGYTLTATLMASIREILGSGTWLGFQVIPESVAKVSIMTQAPGAFFCFGLLMAGCVWLEGKMRIILYGIIFVSVYNMCANVLRAVGDSRTPLYCLIISVFVNIWSAQAMWSACAALARW